MYKINAHANGSLPNCDIARACLRWIKDQGPHGTLHQITSVIGNPDGTYHIDGIKIASMLTFKWSACAEVASRSRATVTLLFDWNGI